MPIMLEMHRNLASVWGFSGDVIPHPKALVGTRYSEIMDDVLTFPRSGWVRRGISEVVAETVSAHCAKVAMAVSIYVDVEGTSDMKRDKERIILTAGLHDLAEWKAPDYTPHDVAAGVVTAEQKRAAEFEALRVFEREYRDPVPHRLFSNLENAPDLPENSLIHQLDKLDAGVMVLNYRVRGYGVEEFFPYTEKKLSDPLLAEAFRWLQQGEFPETDFFYQYCLFLSFRGNVAKVREILESRV